MKKALFTLIAVLSLVCLFCLSASATEYTVSTKAEFDTAYASAVDGDTIIITASISATHDFGKSITYVLEGDGIVWSAGAQCTATGKTVTIASMGGRNTFKPNAGMWCNSYGLTVNNLSSTSWNIGSPSFSGTLVFDMDVVDGRLFYGTFCNQITFSGNTEVFNLYSTNSSGDTNYFKCNTVNIYDGVKIYGNHSNKPLISATSLNMYGGEIYGNACVGMWAGLEVNTFKMYGGSIHHNYQPSPHGTYTNANDPQSVSFVSANKGGALFGGEIYSNFTGLGHPSVTAAGIGCRNGGTIYLVDGVVHSNILVTHGTFGSFVLNERNEYTCEINPANYTNVTDNGDGTFTYAQQITRANLSYADASIIFKSEQGVLLNAFLTRGGAVLTSYSGANEFSVPADFDFWKTSANGTCVDAVASADIVSSKGATYLGASHTLGGERIIYPNGFGASGYIGKACEIDGCSYGLVITDGLNPLITPIGYSVKEDTSYGLGISGGYKLDYDAIEAYETANGVKIELGVIMLNPEFATADSFFQKGALAITDKAIQISASNGKYATLNFMINGFDATMLDLDLIISSYINEIDKNGNIKSSFIQRVPVNTSKERTFEKTDATLYSVSYNSLIEN